MSTPRTSDPAFVQALIAPQSIALIGISGDASKNTARPLRFMRKHGYQGKIYPINATRDEVLGERAYPRIEDVPGPVEHAFVMVPGKHVPDVLEQCGRKGVKVLTIYSDGFGETGEEGQKRQAALVARARELGVRLIGPNSIGIANIRSGGIISVNAVFEMEELSAGHIAMVSQSGSMMGSLFARAAARGFGFSKSFSVGNECDISVGEIVDALVDDDDTRVILLFLETIRDTPAFSAALRRAYAAGKPVVAYKLGRSEQGDAIAQSHTGAIAGNDAAIDAFFRAHGVIRIDMLETLFEIAPLVSRYNRHVSRHEDKPRVAVITTTGGGAATVVDNLGLRGLEAATPPADFIAHMAGRGLTLRQTPIIDLTLAATSAQYQDLLEQLLLSDWCDAVLSVAGSSAQFHPELVVKPLVATHKPDSKPLVAFLAPQADASLRLLQQNDIAAFRTPETCADALAAFFRRRAPRDVAADAAFAWPADLPAHGNLTEYESGQVFARLGVGTAKTQLLKDGDRNALAYPVVVKVSSRDIAHKTDVGGVKIGIRDEQALAQAIADIRSSVGQAKPEAVIDGMLVQEMQGKLIELMLGYRLDPLVGPTVVLSAGGITAELNPDFAIRTAPIDLPEAHAMIREVKLTQLVRGFRGLPKGDVEALAQTLVAFSRLACIEGATVSEAEINPLFVREDGVVAVDGLVCLK